LLPRIEDLSASLRWARVGIFYASRSRRSTFQRREGVDVIWRPTDRGCVCVGQGNIRERLTAHRVDREITDCTPYTGELLVTWADVDWRYHDGVEQYLGEVLQAIVGRRFPDVASIEVNLPS